MSRELSDAEDALTQEVDHYMTAPSYAPDSSLVDSAGAYGILREELKMRTLKNQELSQRQQIAFADSARTALAKDSEENNAYKDEAKSYFEGASALMQEEGISQQDAFTKMNKAHPTAWMNPVVASSLPQFAVMNEDKNEKALREMDQKTNLNNATLRHALSAGEVAPEYLDMTVKAMQARVKASPILAQNQEYMAKLDNVTLERDWQEAQKNENRWKETTRKQGGDPEGVEEDLKFMLFDMGVTNMDPNTLLSSPRPSGMTEAERSFITDKNSLKDFAKKMNLLVKKNDPNDPDEGDSNALLELLSPLGDPKIVAAASGDAPDADSEAQLTKARGLLSLGAGFVRHKYRDQMALSAQADKLEKVREGLSKEYSRAIYGIRGVLLDPNKYKLNSQGKTEPNTSSAQAQARAFLATYAQSRGIDLVSTIPMDVQRARVIAAYPAWDPRNDPDQEVTDEAIKAKGEDLGFWINDYGVPSKANGKDTAENYLLRLETHINTALSKSLDTYGVSRNPLSNRPLTEEEEETGSSRPAIEEPIRIEADEVSDPDLNKYRFPKK